LCGVASTFSGFPTSGTATVDAGSGWTQNEPALQPGFADADTSVAAAIRLYGYYGRTESGLPEISHETHVHADAPPLNADRARSTFIPCRPEV
jgi:hypothetical protein